MILSTVFGLGWGEVFLILMILLLLCGAGKWRELGRGLREGMDGFLNRW